MTQQTIFEALRDDHDTQRRLADQLVETSGDSEDRAELFSELLVELRSHAAAEERHFYAHLMQHDPTMDKARHSVAEHKELDDYLEKLESYERTAPQWLETARLLHERLTHHLDEEEHEVFQMAGKVLPETLKTDLGRKYSAEMNEQREAERTA